MRERPALCTDGLDAASGVSLRITGCLASGAGLCKRREELGPHAHGAKARGASRLVCLAALAPRPLHASNTRIRIDAQAPCPGGKDLCGRRPNASHSLRRCARREHFHATALPPRHHAHKLHAHKRPPRLRYAQSSSSESSPSLLASSTSSLSEAALRFTARLPPRALAAAGLAAAFLRALGRSSSEASSSSASDELSSGSLLSTRGLRPRPRPPLAAAGLAAARPRAAALPPRAPPSSCEHGQAWHERWRYRKKKPCCGNRPRRVSTSAPLTSLSLASSSSSSEDAAAAFRGRF